MRVVCSERGWYLIHADLLPIRPPRAHFNDLLFKIPHFSFTKKTFEITIYVIIGTTPCLCQYFTPTGSCRYFTPTCGYPESENIKLYIHGAKNHDWENSGSIASSHDSYYRADSRFAPSQWETALLCNDVSHWLGASLESSLLCIVSLHALRHCHRRTNVLPTKYCQTFNYKNAWGYLYQSKGSLKHCLPFVSQTITEAVQCCETRSLW